MVKLNIIKWLAQKYFNGFFSPMSPNVNDNIVALDAAVESEFHVQTGKHIQVVLMGFHAQAHYTH